MSASGLESIFEHIAANKLWGAEHESISGAGSTVEANKYRVEFLAKFIKDNNITHLIDIPCGDCTWQHTIKGLDNITYIGADISPTALKLAREKNKERPYMHFYDRTFDLTKEVPVVPSPDTSLIMIKEVVQHLTFQEGMDMLKNAKASGIKYIAITNHAADIFDVKSNIQITSGSFYPNNVFMAPFFFKNPIRDIEDDIGKELSRGYGNLIIFNLQEWAG
jgi:hypothetical protein